jgi:hypothetical protein
MVAIWAYSIFWKLVEQLQQASGQQTKTMVAIWAMYSLLEASGTTSTGKWTADKDHMGHIASSGG